MKNPNLGFRFGFLRLTKNERGNITMIDMKELDEIEKELALYKFKYEMALAEKSINEEGTISADDLEEEF
jgi:hypothetical protein